MNSIFKKPWGHYKVLQKGKKYLIKNIFVKPGGKLSLQSHRHRSEHWIVVKGIAKVTIDKKIATLKTNQSIFIPRLSKHRLENTHKMGLNIIEVQYGNILSEKDIIRYEDIYERI
tara:strand:+ start:206 stop:550 length:345 start_codon:yes stop_codon:yes gene_type:complete